MVFYIYDNKALHNVYESIALYVNYLLHQLRPAALNLLFFKGNFNRHTRLVLDEEKNKKITLLSTAVKMINNPLNLTPLFVKDNKFKFLFLYASIYNVTQSWA